MRKVILVHGAWHGSWCWSLVTQQLASRDIPSVAVDLDGYGLKGQSPRSRWSRPFDAAAFAREPSPAAGVTATTAATTLVEQIRVIGGGEPCVVVAHSMGGTVATAAAELAPELFAHLVYVSGFAPVSGLPAGYYVSLPECASTMVNGLISGVTADAGALRIDTGDQGLHPAIRETFFADVDEATAAAAIGLLSPDQPVAMPAEAFTVTPGRYGTVPHTYVTCTKDNANPIALQHRFIAEIDAVSKEPTTVVELDSSHSPFLSQPAILAVVIADAR